ncbi:MAG: glycoside hydrolase family 3 protein [Gemmatimonadaceae bacterium]
MTTPTDSRTIAARVDALLSRMTLDQKLGQMMQPERMAASPDDVRAHHIGSILSGGGSCPGDNRPADWIAMNDAYWAASMSDGDGRVPIPLLYGVDAIHGHANVLGATVFPHNIGLGAANDPDLLERIAQATAREILATGVEWTFAPTLAVARDLRWGRTYESYSEDPALVARYAAPFVRGLQAELGRDGVVACAKHWVGDGGTEHGYDQGNTIVGEDELTKLHIAPYLPALDAGVLTVMASFNSWNGDKCHGHRYLLTDVLKGRLGFEGFVISDWDGVDYLDPDYATAIARAVNAGVDMLMVSVEWRACLAHLKRLVAEGAIPVARIDDAVRRILWVKHRYGLFERPRPAERYWSQRTCLGAAEHRAVAREAVRKSLVLLKNEGGILPLAPGARLLVAGRNADNRGHQCGGFTVAWQGTSGNGFIHGGTSIWEGIRAVAPDATLSVDGSAADAATHDVAIVVIGEHPYAEGMGDLRGVETIGAGSAFGGKNLRLAPYGDSLELAALHPEDLATIRAIRAKGIPVVTVLVSGRPLVVNAELAESAAFVAAWLPGSEGAGVADVLFGAFDFQGALSFAWPATVDGATAEARSREALYPRGHGLTYGAGR